MLHIRLLYSGKQDENNQSSRKLEVNGISPVNVVEKKQLNQLDRVVVVLSEPIDSLTIIEWVLATREKKAIFIWILCSYCTKYLRNLCCHLRNNNIIETGFQDIDELPIFIKNALNYRHKASRAEYHKKMNLILYEVK